MANQALACVEVMFDDSSDDEDVMADLLVQAAAVVAENGTPRYVCIHLC